MTGANGRRILVVEDDDLERASLVELLRLWGYEARAASDGWQALHEVASSGIDLVLTDVCMPYLSGIELLEELRRHLHFVNCVMISGQENEIEEYEAKRLGARSFLRKPIDPDQLRAEIGKALDAPWEECIKVSSVGSQEATASTASPLGASSGFIP